MYFLKEIDNTIPCSCRVRKTLVTVWVNSKVRLASACDAKEVHKNNTASFSLWTGVHKENSTHSVE